MLEVIGAGLGRTGTHSLGLALEKLGFGPCYNIYEVGKNPSHQELWKQKVIPNEPFPKVNERRDLLTRRRNGRKKSERREGSILVEGKDDGFPEEETEHLYCPPQ
jgi:hypothetical protein